jgi:hypothetical protein
MVEINLEGKKKPAQEDVPHASDDAGQRTDAPAEAASRARPRQPPHARGASQAIAFQQDAQPRKRGRAAELTEADRARMIREVQARLESESGDAISLVSHDDQSDRPARARSQPTGRRLRNPLADDDQSPATGRESEQESDDELSDPVVPAAAGVRSARHAAKHPLDDDDSLVPTDSAPVRSRQSPGANRPKKSAAHLLDEASTRPAWSGEEGSAQTFTIQLSKSVFDGS